MFTDKTKVLLILTQDVLDRARVLAGKTTTTLKLPVSLQIVLRALIEVGLKRDNHPALLANVEGQAKAVRHQRSVAGATGLVGYLPPAATELGLQTSKGAVPSVNVAGVTLLRGGGGYLQAFPTHPSRSAA